MSGAIIHSPNTPSWRCAHLQKAQEQLYLYLFTFYEYFITESSMPKFYVEYTKL
jgi:hypothetical protein